MSATKSAALQAELDQAFPLRNTGDPQQRLIYYAEALERYKQLCAELETGKQAEKPKADPEPAKPAAARATYRR
jgi:hypothetical protein